MFTGIVENQAKVLGFEGYKLLISNPFSKNPLLLGQSIAVDGCCLTAVRFTDAEIEFDLSPETFGRTIFGKKKPGEIVNLERGLKMGAPLDGHWVTGHVDSTGIVKEVTETSDKMKILRFEVSPKHLPWLIEKGSISINGVSLTVNHLFPTGFDVMLIPHTLDVTNLKNLKPGDPVNLEFDILAKYVERMMQFKTSNDRAAQ